MRTEQSNIKNDQHKQNVKLQDFLNKINPVSYLINRNLDFDDRGINFKPALQWKKQLSFGDYFGLDDLMQTKFSKATYATSSNSSQIKNSSTENYIEMVILDYKLFQLHLEKYFRERLNEYKILIKQKALNDEVYD